MINYSNISYFKPYKDGVRVIHHAKNNTYTISFAFDAKDYIQNCKEFGVALYDSNNKIRKISFSKEGNIGSLYGLKLENVSSKKEYIIYNFYADNNIICDKKATAYTQNKEFGDIEGLKNIKGVCYLNSFDWGDEASPNISYDDLIIYGLNVRSFTKDSSSKVKHKGTFEGVSEKLDYLKDLGINAICLMPCYEFDECHNIRKENSKISNIDEIQKRAMLRAPFEGRIDCWGFSEGYYYAPKNSYSSDSNPVFAFKNLIKNAHQKGIEVFMHMYFPESVAPEEMLSILKFWAIEYRIDGFRVNGFYLPMRSFFMDSVLKGVKLWFSYINEDELGSYQNLFGKKLASDNRNFKNDMRRFLKADEGLLSAFADYQRNKKDKYSYINYLADYDGFTLYDLYSYERKHNEANGEDNYDGENNNFSWNCGVEGESRKKAVINLRKKQIKNALALLFLCCGIPYIYSGDEFANSRYGNNNTYCQDNETGYVKWKKNALSKEICDYTKQIISLRKNHKILNMPDQLTSMDTNESGYPDLSYHGIEAFRADFGYNSRMLGIFLCNKQNDNDISKSLYIGINMHWQKHRLAIPKLKGDYAFVKILDTDEREGNSKDNEIPVNERSVVVLEVR